MIRDFAGRVIRTDNTPIVTRKSKPVRFKAQSQSDIDNYDRERDESPMFLIGYRDEFDMDSKEMRGIK